MATGLEAVTVLRAVDHTFYPTIDAARARVDVQWHRTREAKSDVSTGCGTITHHSLPCRQL